MKETKKEKTRNMRKNLRYGFSFLEGVLLLYVFLFFTETAKTYEAVFASFKMMINIVPILFVVIILMGLINYFLKPGVVARYLGTKSGIKRLDISCFCRYSKSWTHLRMVSLVGGFTKAGNEKRTDSSFSI